MLVRSRAIVHKYAPLWLSIVRAGRKQHQRYSYLYLLSQELCKRRVHASKQHPPDVIGNPEFITQYLLPGRPPAC